MPHVDFAGRRRFKQIQAFLLQPRVHRVIRRARMGVALFDAGLPQPVRYIQVMPLQGQSGQRLAGKSAHALIPEPPIQDDRYPAGEDFPGLAAQVFLHPAGYDVVPVAQIRAVQGGDLVHGQDHRLFLFRHLPGQVAFSGADFSADLSAGQFYLSEDQLREIWGSSFEKSRKKIKDACDSVYGLVLTDNKGELIDAAYHAISNGSTENSEDVFGIRNEHLRSVASPGDAFAPDYITDVVFSCDEFRDNLKATGAGISFSGKPENYIKSIDRTDAGTVRSIEICNYSFTGDQIRKAFSLRSASFEVEYSNKLFTFTVRGYGHGVGLSQYGAQYMAKNGADFKEILTHYYKDIRLDSAID